MLEVNNITMPEESHRKKRAREDEWTEASQTLLVKFLAELTDAAVRYGELGEAVHMDERARWVQGWLDDLKEENFLDECLVDPLLTKILVRKNRLKLVGSLQTIYTLAKAANAQMSDFEYVLSRGDKSRSWATIVKKLLVACMKWKKLSSRKALDIAMLREMTDEEGATKRFMTLLYLDTSGMPGPNDPNDHSAEHFQVEHRTYGGRSFFNLKFAATVTTAAALINRLPRGADDYFGKTHRVTSENDSAEAEEPQGDDSSVPVQEPSRVIPSVYAPHIITSKLSEHLCSDSRSVHIVISVSGETGSGKTTSVLLALNHHGFVIFYAVATDLDISSIEEALLKTGKDKSKHVAMAANYLIAMLTDRNWKPTQPTDNKVALVIDELGKYPLFTRAIAKITEAAEDSTNHPAKRKTESDLNKDLSTSIELFQRHFMSSDVRLILVGTGTDHAFSVVGLPLPSTHVHVSANDFGDLMVAYENSSKQWQIIKNTLDPLELERGVFSKILRLSRNPRMAAILVGALDPIRADDLLSKVQSRGAKQSLLRDHYSYVLCGALRDIRKFNAMRYLHPLEATTHFSCAFAIACSNEKQGGDQPLLQTYISTYGLLRDCTPLVTEKNDIAPHPAVAVAELTEETEKTNETETVPEVMTHRFEMSPATVEMGISHFGMSMPNDGWVGFESMMCSLLYLHALGASSAASLSIRLSDVVCMDEQLSQDKADPIALVKAWIRLHAKRSRCGRVVQASLEKQVRSCGEAAAALKALAEEQVNINEARRPCIVIARNCDFAPFANVMVGVVAFDDGAYNTTHLLLLQLKNYDDSDALFSVHDEWREMYKMGSTHKYAVVADCAAKLEKYRWDDAMSRIHVAEHRASECKKLNFGNPAGREDVFVAICQDPTTSQRELCPYHEALQQFTHAGVVSVPALAAKLLNGQLLKKTTELDEEKIALAFGMEKHQANDDFVLAVHEILKSDKEIDQQFHEIMEKYRSCERSTARREAPSRFPQLQKSKLEVDRYLVMYHNTETAPVQRRGDFPHPENVLVINSLNKVAAFYPTGWEKETFKQETSVRDVVEWK